MISINTNLSSLIIQSNLKTSTNGLNLAIERMTTGFKLNHAKDNAANYSISTSITTKLGAYNTGEENALMGLDMVQTASETLEEMSDRMSRLRTLATQAQNGTYGNSSIDAINSEASALIKELNRLQTTAEYNGIKLFIEDTKDASTPSTHTARKLASRSAIALQSSDSSNFIKPVNSRNTSGMTSLSNVDENSSLTSGTYSISTKEDLIKFSTMCTNGKLGSNTEFVLANDIDLSGVNWAAAKDFSGIFDGNGFTISNLCCQLESDFAGLFGTVTSGTVKNLNLKNVNSVASDGYAGGIVAIISDGGKIDNCLVSGSINGAVAGGVVGAVQDGGSISNTNFSGNVTGVITAAGITSYMLRETLTISGCSVMGQIKSNDGYVAGLVALSDSPSATGNLSISNSYSASDLFAGDETKSAAILGLSGTNTSVSTSNCYYDNTKKGQTVGINGATDNTKGVTTEELIKLIQSGILPSSDLAQAGSNAANKTLNLQIGINATDSSQIELNLAGIDFSALNGIDLSNGLAFDTIDNILTKINEQQTNLGAIENRLNSALDEISTHYENLLSTQSTIRDADIANLSSEYIRNQILQQATATLLATANQTPAVALQLL